MAPSGSGKLDARDRLVPGVAASVADDVLTLEHNDDAVRRHLDTHT